jgi:hypothetical protein
MEFNVDDHSEINRPWDLSVTIGGIGFKVHPLTAGDLASMQTIGAAQMKSTGQIVAFVDSLFEDHKPDISTLDGGRLVDVMATAMSYWTEAVKANALAVNAAMMAARRAMVGERWWDLYVMVGGNRYKVHQLGRAQAASLEQIAAGQIRLAGEIIAAVDSLFDGRKPDVARLTLEQLLLIACVVLAYWNACAVVKVSRASQAMAPQRPPTRRWRRLGRPPV